MAKKSRDFEESVIAVITATKPGDVVTYGEIAAEAGFPGAARAVGTIMRNSDGTLPWWRVVSASGKLIVGHEAEHERRLRREGVEVRNGRIVPTSD